jgi:predicted RNase H-like nuclease (RuvC/YqgF family)
MGMTNAERQARHRARQKARIAAMEEALRNTPPPPPPPPPPDAAAAELARLRREVEELRARPRSSAASSEAVTIALLRDELDELRKMLKRRQVTIARLKAELRERRVEIMAIKGGTAGERAAAEAALQRIRGEER